MAEARKVLENHIAKDKSRLGVLRLKEERRSAEGRFAEAVSYAKQADAIRERLLVDVVRLKGMPE